MVYQELTMFLYGTKQNGGTDIPVYFNITSKGDFGLLNPQDMNDVGRV